MINCAPFRAPGRDLWNAVLRDCCPLINNTFMICQRKFYTLITGKFSLFPPLQCGCGKLITSCSGLSILCSWEVDVWAGGRDICVDSGSKGNGLSQMTASSPCERKSVEEVGRSGERREASGNKLYHRRDWAALAMSHLSLSVLSEGTGRSKE